MLGELWIERVVGNTGMKDLIPNGVVVSMFALPLLIQLAFYILRSVGLFTLGKKNKLKTAWMAWIPLVWIYPAFRLLGNGSVMGMPVKSVALIGTILFALGEGLAFAYSFIQYFSYIGYYLQGGEITLKYYGEGMEIVTKNDFFNPFPSVYVGYMRAISVVSSLLSIVNVVITVTLYINLFKRFWPQYFIFAAVFSALGLFGPFVFAIRKKEPIKYEDYLRSRYGGMYYGGPYGNPYYGRNPNPNEPKPPENPFEEFAGRGEKDPGDPFAEFSDGDKKNGDN